MLFSVIFFQLEVVVARIQSDKYSYMGLKSD